MRTAGVGSGAILRDVEQATMNVAAVQTIAPKVGSFIDNLMIYRKTSDRQVLIYVSALSRRAFSETSEGRQGFPGAFDKAV